MEKLTFKEKYFCPLTMHQSLYFLPVGCARFHFFLWPWIRLRSIWSRTGKAQESKIYSGKAHLLQSVYAEQKLWNIMHEQIRGPCSDLISKGSLGWLNQEKNMWEEEMSFLPHAPFSHWSCPSSFWNLTTASHRATWDLWLLAWWKAAKGKSESRMVRDWNMLAHTSEWLRQKSKLKGGKSLYCEKKKQLVFHKFRKSILW